MVLRVRRAINSFECFLPAVMCFVKSSSAVKQLAIILREDELSHRVHGGVRSCSLEEMVITRMIDVQ